MKWIDKETNSYVEAIPPYKFGFIYILCFESGMFYIGRKSFYSFKTLKPLKGYKRNRKVIKESDWRKYIGSSKEIPNTDKLAKKIILAYGNSKQHLSYLEEKHLFHVDACINPEFYNKNISGRYFDNVDRVCGEYLKYLGE